MLKIAVLISGNGSNMQSIIDHIHSGELKCKIEMVISDNPNAYGLVRAKDNEIPTYIFNRNQYKEGLSDEILKCVDGKADYIVLAGYLSILQGKLLEVYKNRILNIHPSLIPSFCGKGFYGIKVHEAAIEYGVKVSGCTVHFVDVGTDTGPILLQKIVSVEQDDTPQSLQKKILLEEHKAIVEAVRILCEEKLHFEGRKIRF